MTKKVVKILEEMDFRICGTYKQDEEFVSELEWYSPAGEDIIITIWHDNTDEDFVDGFSDYVLDFDPDEHAEMYVDIRGTRGVPDSIRVLIDDADAIKEHLEETLDALSALQAS